MTPDPVLFLDPSEVTHLITLKLLLALALAFRNYIFDNVADVLFLRGPEKHVSLIEFPPNSSPP